MFQSPNSLIDDDRLLVGDKEVSFTVKNPQQTDIYSMPSDDYSRELQKSIFGNPQGMKR